MNINCGISILGNPLKYLEYLECGFSSNQEILKLAQQMDNSIQKPPLWKKTQVSILVSGNPQI